MSLVWLTMSKVLKKSIAMVNLRCDNPGGRVTGVGSGEVNCLAKAFAMSLLLVRDLEENVMG